MPPSLSKSKCIVSSIFRVLVQDISESQIFLLVYLFANFTSFTQFSCHWQRDPSPWWGGRTSQRSPAPPLVTLPPGSSGTSALGLDQRGWQNAGLLWWKGFTTLATLQPSVWIVNMSLCCRCNGHEAGLQMAIPLQAPTVEVQRGEYGAVEVESVLTVGLSNRRMTVECVAYNLVGISSDTFTVEVSGECGTHFGDVMLNSTVFWSESKKNIRPHFLWFFSFNWADKLFTSTLTGAASVLAFLIMLLGFLLYKYKQVGCITKAVSQSALRKKNKQKKPLNLSKTFLAFRNQDTKSAGRSLKPEMETTTHSLTPLSCLTMTSGSFQETNWSLVSILCG